MSASSSQRPALPLLKILETQVLPSWELGGMERCLVAPDDLEDRPRLQQWLATGATLSAAPYKGRRIAVKGPRDYNNRNTNLAHWPEDGLREYKTPIFVHVVRGTTDFQIGDRMVHCSAGHSLLVLPGTPRPDGSTSHLAGHNRRQGFCELLWIGGAINAGIGCWICHSEGERHFELPGESCHIPDPTIMALLESFYHEAAARRNGYREISQYILQSLLMTVCREIRDERIFQFNHQKPETARAINQQKPIEAAQSYMKNHLHQSLRINDVAHRFHLSRTDFTSQFRRETGKSFSEYLTDLRLAEASHLLKTTDWSVAMIAQAVSFKSSRLRVLFNRRYGVSPAQYRKQHQSSLVEEKPIKKTRKKISIGDA